MFHSHVWLDTIPESHIAMDSYLISGCFGLGRSSNRIVCVCVCVDSCWFPGWWFGTFFIFPYIGINHPNWLFFFRGVGSTTNQSWCIPWLVETLLMSGGAVPLPTSRDWNLRPILGGEELGLGRWGVPPWWSLYNGNPWLINPWFFDRVVSQKIIIGY